MLLCAVVLLTTATSCVCAVRPGFKARITQHALDYGKQPQVPYSSTRYMYLTLERKTDTAVFIESREETSECLRNI